MDPLEKMVDRAGPGRPAGGGMDRDVPAGEDDEESGGAGFVSPLTGTADPSATERYESEIAAESTGTSADERETSGEWSHGSELAAESGDRQAGDRGDVVTEGLDRGGDDDSERDPTGRWSS